VSPASTCAFHRAIADLRLAGVYPGRPFQPNWNHAASPPPNTHGEARLRLGRLVRERVKGIDAFACPKCRGRMRILALVRNQDEVRRFLQALGEPTTPPKRAPA